MTDTEDGLPPEAKELFALPLTGFTAARDALHKRLRSEGRDLEAAAVKLLRKPSLTAWAMNQVAHRSPKKVAWLLRSADRMREAASKVQMREASASRTELVSGFVDEAMEVLASSGHPAGPSASHKMAHTLLAAIADPALGAQLSDGMLRADVSAGEPDLSWGGSLPPTQTPSERDAATEEVERLHEGWQEAVARANRLKARADEAAAVAEKAESDAAGAKEMYDEAVSRLGRLPK